MTASADRPPPPALVKPDSASDLGSVPGLNETRLPYKQHPHPVTNNIDAGRREQNPNHTGPNPDFVDDLFLNSEKPTIALFAISICLVGVMDLLPRERHDPDVWKDKLELVSGFYGPGAVISWCLSGVSMNTRIASYRVTY
ncbi:hypothetical protein LTR56_026668 [Elasticomyces elasticus]|nr:hypothetical protein LTR56_026668 [Elasticomyces elasticus]KAK3618439.1 hypothetical protein LTR22_026376 [Elasticomyces elasticus]